MKSHRILIIYLIMICLLNCSLSYGQNGVFFKDSQNEGFYDSGLAFFTSPSTLAQFNGDKIPTNTLFAAEGTNSLELSWQSASGGDWSAIVIAPGFNFQDITDKDTLFFYAYSPLTISASNLPYIFMEGDPGVTKSNKYDLAQFLPAGLPAEEWIPVKIPLKIFFDDPTQTGINFNLIKAIIFGQKNADNVAHTVYIDFVAALAGDLSTKPSAPEDLTAKGFERHTELRWNQLPGASSIIVDIYRSSDSGSTFTKVGETQDSIYIDFTGETGRNIDFTYKFQSRKPTGAASEFSQNINVATHDMTDEQLLDMVQEYTFRYFWEFAHPVSGLAYERNTSVSSQTVTSGGSGFGIMAIPVAIERSFITRQQGINRVLKIINFLDGADRFHGAWSHWLNGSTGTVIPFFEEDNGGDLVETSFLIQGLLTLREYFDGDNAEEKEIRDKITALWEGVEWDWYRQKPTDGHLTWHWSPNFGWKINHALHGWNEVMITYMLAVASPTHPIPSNLYHSGWAFNGAIKNDRTKYGIDISLGSGNGGPLFFTHYSFLGFNPNGYIDKYANYFNNNRAQSLINIAYCTNNPGNYQGYSKNCWGLTASDDPDGYLAHEPDPAKDNGTISPTAALSSMPYTPNESLAALRHFYQEHGDRLWGTMGFKDAFNVSRNWYASSYLAIDQGPIIVMIENYRTGLLWNNFKKNSEIGDALEAINNGGVSITAIDKKMLLDEFSIYPNPSGNIVTILLPENAKFYGLYTLDGKMIALKEESIIKNGSNEVRIKIEGIPTGTYISTFIVNNKMASRKIIIQ